MASTPRTTMSYAGVLKTPDVVDGHARSFTAPAVFSETAQFSKIISEQEVEQKQSPVVENQGPSNETFDRPLPDGHWSICSGTFAVDNWEKAPGDSHADHWYFDMMNLACSTRNDKHQEYTIESGEWQAIMGENAPVGETLYARIASPSKTPAPLILSASDTTSMASKHLSKAWETYADIGASFFYKGVEFRFGLKWQFPKKIQYHMKCYELDYYCERFGEGQGNYGSYPGTVKCELTGKIHNVHD